MTRILLGITGSIAAYKTPELIRLLRERGCEVKVVLTASGKSFVTPLTLQAINGEAVYESLLDPEAEAVMSHISLARWADRILIAPASANFITKLTHGFAEDLLSTLCLATQSPIFIAPAMNQAMWANAATQENIQKLQQRSVKLIGPASGIQACGETGLGRMVEPHDIVQQLFSAEQFLKGKKILITAGPTQEAIDPVRFLSNRSSGKMGYALAQAALNACAEVTLISGPVKLAPPQRCNFVNVLSADDMFNAVKIQLQRHDIFISAAAVADYRLAMPYSEKIKKTETFLNLELEKTPDILQWVCEQNPRLFCVGFAAETENVLENAQQKMLRKNVDMLVVNDVGRKDIGFDNDKNAVTILCGDKRIVLERAAKLEIAKKILREINISHNDTGSRGQAAGRREMEA